MALPSPLGRNGNNKHDDQSLCDLTHDHVIVGKPRHPKDNAKFPQENLANLHNEVNAGNTQRDPIEPTADFYQPCKLDSSCFEHLKEDSPTNVEGNMSVADMPASASSNAALQESITEVSKQDTVDHSTMVQPQSCRGKSPDPAQYDNGEEPHDDGASDQSSRDLSHGGLSMQPIIASALDRSGYALPTNASETSHLPEFITGQDTTIIPQADSGQTYLASSRHDSGENVNQDLYYDGTSIQPVENPVENDCIHKELTLEAAGILPSVSCNGVIQGDKYETNHLLGNIEEHAALFGQPNGGNRHLEICCADIVNQALYSDGGILEDNMVHGELSVQSSGRTYSVALRNEISEANYLSVQNIEKSTIDVHKFNCSITSPTAPQDDSRGSIKQISNVYTVVKTSYVHSSDESFSGFVDKMSFFIKDQDTDGSPRGCSEQESCIKCGKDGQLLKCSTCLLAAHDSCFGPSMPFEDSTQFCCPVCFYIKATEAYKKAKNTYCEARMNLTAFLGTEQLAKQHDEQPPAVLPIACSKDHLDGYNALKRKNNQQTKMHTLARSDEKADRQRKKQKTNATIDVCPKESMAEKASSVRNSDIEPMNKHSVLQNISNQVQDTEKEQQVEKSVAREEAGNGDLCDGTTNSSHGRCRPSAINQEVNADKDGFINPNQSENSDEMEAASFNESGKQSLPPLHNIRQSKSGLRERETPVSRSSGKVLVRDQHMPSPSRKRNYADPTNRISNPVTPTGRRLKLCWTEEEEVALREAMEKFAPQDNMPIPWVQILEYGRDVFHRARLPCDLRVKWRNMMKKAGS